MMFFSFYEQSHVVGLGIQQHHSRREAVKRAKALNQCDWYGYWAVAPSRKALKAYLDWVDRLFEDDETEAPQGVHTHCVGLCCRDKPRTCPCCLTVQPARDTPKVFRTRRLVRVSGV